MSTQKPRSRKGIGERIIDGEALLVNAEGGEILVLNEVGSFVWTLLDGEHDVAAIAQRVCEEFETDAATAQQDVAAFLGTLAARDLLER